MPAHILIVEDSSVDLEYLSNLVTELGYTFDSARTVSEALERLKQERYHILLADLGLPDGDGETLIDTIERERMLTIPVIVSGHLDVDRIIRLLRFNRASDYLIKPIGLKRLETVLEEAYEAHQKRKKVVEFSKDETELYRQAIQIFDWKQEIKSHMLEFVASNMIHQMNLGLFQGEGLGGLMSAISMFLYEKRDADGSIRVSSDLADLLKDGFESMQGLIQSLQQAQTILQTTVLPLHAVSLGDIHGMTVDLVASLKDDLRRKSQRIIVSDLQFEPGVVRIHKESLHKAANELLVNAMKYAPAQSEIYVLVMVKDRHLEWKVLNAEPADMDPSRRITGNLEYLVFEPFFRLNTTVDEGYASEQFPLGLGLTVVKKCIELCGGTIFVNRVESHINGNRSAEVCFTVRLPIGES